MQLGTDKATGQAQPPVEREEDSGLHDIRNLAASARMRLSSKRISTSPPPMEDDALASSSGSFKNIALPQPAKMVSLPELAEMPVEHRPSSEKIEAPQAKKEKPAKSEKIAKVTVSIAQDAPVATPATSSRFSLPSQQQRRSKAPLFAVLGLGVAAAAGYIVYTQVLTGDESTSKPAAVAVNSEAKQTPVQAPAPAPAPAPTSAAAATGTATQEPTKVAGEAQPAEGAPAQIADDKDAAKVETKAAVAKPKAKAPAKGGKKTVEKTEKADKPETKTETKPVTKEAPTQTKKGAANAKDGEDFDALLKEAGVQEKKDTKPKLDKKELSGDDFKKGVASVEGRAKGCYKGTQGTAVVKLTIAPSGAVSKISIGGDFAGKAEGACVQSAMQSAKFPPWDGPPKTFTYPVLLSD